MSTRQGVAIGALGGVWAIAALLFPSRNALIPLLALAGPIAAGAIVAVRKTRREQRELDVDEAAYLGLVTGLAAGFVVAVPFPVAVSLFAPERLTKSSPAWISTAGAVASVTVAIVLLMIAVTLSVAAAVIASRFARKA